MLYSRVQRFLNLNDIYPSLARCWPVHVLYPGKGECADPVNEDAILEEEGGGEPQDRNGERQLASDTGGGKT
jgi:hypothetical protein